METINVEEVNHNIGILEADILLLEARIKEKETQVKNLKDQLTIHQEIQDRFELLRTLSTDKPQLKSA